jgi:hypothetical protein
MNRAHLFSLLLLALSACQSAKPGTEGASSASQSREDVETETSRSTSSRASTLEEALELMSLELKAKLADRSEAMHVTQPRIENLTDESIDTRIVGERVKAALQKVGNVTFDLTREEKRKAFEEYEAGGYEKNRPEIKPVEAMLSGRIKRLEDSAETPEAARYKLVLSLHRLDEEKPFWTSEKSFR